jgi:hypothetical protein
MKDNDMIPLDLKGELQDIKAFSKAKLERRRNRRLRFKNRVFGHDRHQLESKWRK